MVEHSEHWWILSCDGCMVCCALMDDDQQFFIVAFREVFSYNFYDTFQFYHSIRVQYALLHHPVIPVTDNLVFATLALMRS